MSSFFAHVANFKKSCSVSFQLILIIFDFYKVHYLYFTGKIHPGDFDDSRGPKSSQPPKRYMNYWDRTFLLLETSDFDSALDRLAWMVVEDRDIIDAVLVALDYHTWVFVSALAPAFRAPRMDLLLWVMKITADAIGRRSERSQWVLNPGTLMYDFFHFFKTGGDAKLRSYGVQIMTGVVQSPDQYYSS